MSVRVVLLRAVNVGGAKLPMALLRDLATDLGATDVSTYIASGNLIADVPGDPDEFDRALEKAIEAECGFFREAISRTHDELVAARKAHPFDVVEPKFSYVTFLTEAPTQAAIEHAREVPTGADEWDIVGRDMHIRYANGAGRPDMKSETIGRRLNVVGTARNLNSVNQLIERSV